MQTLLQVICKPGPSLRDAIVKDPRLADFQLQLAKQHKPGRPKGWAKIHSLEHPGAINIEWDADVAILICRFVNRQRGRPDGLLGDFVRYLFSRRHPRIQALHILPR